MRPSDNNKKQQQTLVRFFEVGHLCQAFCLSPYGGYRIVNNTKATVRLQAKMNGKHARLRRNVFVPLCVTLTREQPLTNVNTPLSHCKIQPKWFEPKWLRSCGTSVVASEPSSNAVYIKIGLATLCYAIRLPGRRAGFRAGCRPDSNRASIQISSPAGLRPARGLMLKLSRLDSGRNLARKPDFRSGCTIA